MNVLNLLLLDVHDMVQGRFTTLGRLLRFSASVNVCRRFDLLQSRRLRSIRLICVPLDDLGLRFVLPRNLRIPCVARADGRALYHLSFVHHLAWPLLVS